jgi:hypothetical protein
MYFNCHAKVVINDYTLETVVSVETHNDSNHIGSYCDIVLPLNSRIEFNGNPDQAQTSNNQDPQIDYSQVNQGYLTAPTRYLFNTGDHIAISSKYDGMIYENDINADNDGYLPVFEGFIYDFYESTPIKIKCLDFIYWFNIGIYGNKIVTIVKGKKKPKTSSGTGVSFKTTTFKAILKDLIETVNYNIAIWNQENDTSYPDVELMDAIFDMPLVNISFVQMSPAAVLEWFKKELGLNITLMGNKLYANLASNTTSTVVLQTDTNVLQSSLQTTNLQKTKNKGSNSIFLRVKVKAYFLQTNGTKDSIEVGDPNGQLREVFFYNVKRSETLYKKMANEALVKFHQDRYTGEIETYLYPYCDLFWKVKYYDVRYPERNGSYVVTMVKTILSENGFHRKLKLAYLDDQT